jgi:hypothetical protein
MPRGDSGAVGPPAGALDARNISGDARVRAGGVLWSQSYDGAWSASSDGESLPHRRAFGWANGYTLAKPGPVSFSYGDQWLRYPAVLIELVLVAGAFLLWRGSASFRRRRPVVEVAPSEAAP